MGTIRGVLARIRARANTRTLSDTLTERLASARPAVPVRLADPEFVERFPYIVGELIPVVQGVN